VVTAGAQMASPPLDVISVDDARQARASSPNKSRTEVNNLVRAARCELEEKKGRSHAVEFGVA
jgi:hypothetical protein